MTDNPKKKESFRDQFTVDIAELRRGPVLIERDIALSRLTEKLKYCEYEAYPKSAHVKVRLEPCGNGILVRGNIEAHIHVKCSTCLADTIIQLVPSISAFLSPKSEIETKSDDQEWTPEDLEKEFYEGEKVVLDEFLIDALMLELPMNPKCAESCYSQANDIVGEAKRKIDPRLAPLADLRVEKER
ncbi:MAG: DUF177 domain-containing protein [Proteobacteria bacterium]|nr:DUF177 domain-containing protein [Pseudomonadota bacterium]